MVSRMASRIVTRLKEENAISNFASTCQGQMLSLNGDDNKFVIKGSFVLLRKLKSSVCDVGRQW